MFLEHPDIKLLEERSRPEQHCYQGCSQQGEPYVSSFQHMIGSSIPPAAVLGVAPALQPTRVFALAVRLVMPARLPKRRNAHPVGTSVGVIDRGATVGRVISYGKGRFGRGA